MTLKERIEYSNLYLSRIRIFEKKYARLINLLLRSQINKVVHVLENHGARYAFHEVRKLILDADLSRLLSHLYKDVGLYFAKKEYINVQQELKKSGSFGQSQQWVQAIQEYFATHLLNNAVIPINANTRSIIEQILNAGERDGLSVETMARQMASEDLTMNRSRLIARTESAKAANVGRQVAVQDIGFEMSKEWITAGDERVRSEHAAVDGLVIDENEDFTVDGEQLQGPGDPSGSPENICNCRCTMAYVPKRGANGRLIQKS